MLTKQDFIDRIEKTIDNYPSIAPLYSAGDPRIRQNVESIATMASMLSQQIEIAQTEVFEKTRETTVKADLAMRGYVPTAAPAVVYCNIHNIPASTYAHSLTGTSFVNESGSNFVVTETFYTTGTNTAAKLEQFDYTNPITITVSDSKPFQKYSIEGITDQLHSVRVTVNGVVIDRSETGLYGVEKGERKYILEYGLDDRYHVCFGDDSLSGFSPKLGDVITIQCRVTKGEDFGSRKHPLALESTADSGWRKDVKLESYEFSYFGRNTPKLDQLRMLTRYPFLYDKNAVYLGEFDYMLRANIKAGFVSVWNESIHENALGSPNIKNINTIFVCIGNYHEHNGKWAGMTYINKDTRSGTIETDPQRCAFDASIHDQATYNPMLLYTKEEHPGGSYADRFHIQSRKLIQNADDSFRIKFIAPRLRRTRVSINCFIDPTHEKDMVSTKIAKVISNRYGFIRDGKQVTLRPFFKPRKKDIYDLLVKEIPEISRAGDITIDIVASQNQEKYPDIISYIDENCVDVEIQYSSEPYGDGWS